MNASNDWFRRRRWRLLHSVDEPEPEPTNIIDSYTWDIAWDGKDALAGSWPGMSGTTTPNATAIASPTLNLSTTGLLADGIGASRVDKAVRSHASGGYGFTSVNWTGGIFHMRFLCNLESVSTGLSRYMFRLYDAADRRIDITHTSGNRWNFSIDAAGSAAAFNPTGPLANTVGWHLLDILYDPTGASGNGRVTFRVDGVESVENDDESIDFVGGTSGLHGVISNNSGSAPFSNARVVFVGVRFLASSGEFTLAQHQSDVTSLGL
ncbi:MAG: hypothetical protein H6729_13590 [Deltaproteobacteria bacterium]|nr:hypothetical protein [Deltaproteobacteria bacterium]